MLVVSGRGSLVLNTNSSEEETGEQTHFYLAMVERLHFSRSSRSNGGSDVACGCVYAAHLFCSAWLVGGGLVGGLVGWWVGWWLVRLP